MAVFKRKRKVEVGGKTITRQSSKWYVKYRNADGIVRTVPGYTDKEATKQLESRLKKEAALAQEGVIDRYKESKSRPLTEHLEDFEKSLLAKGGTAKNAAMVKSRVKRLFDECKLILWDDIQASKVQYTISGLHKYVKTKEGPKDLGEISAQTCNFYLQAIKQFCKWMVQDRRVSQSPVEHLQAINVRVDRRHDRRALDADEMRRLLEATQATPKRFGMTGYERALVYRFAAYTGLRANEIRNLTVSAFDFENHTVKVRAGYSKRRREDTLPLRKDIATELKSFVAGKLPAAQVFNVPEKTADMLKADLKAAGIPYVDDAERYADFHALRHSTGSLLAASGVHPKVVQSIMRHSDINLTMSRYTHIFTGQESDAVAGLPDLSLPSKKKQKGVATGTDGKAGDGPSKRLKTWTPKWTPQWTPTAFPDSDQLSADGSSKAKKVSRHGEHKRNKKRKLYTKSAPLSPGVSHKEAIRPRGLEPLTFGLGNRCSILLSYGRFNPNSLQYNGLLHMPSTLF